MLRCLGKLIVYPLHRLAAADRRNSAGHALKVWRSALDRRKPVDWREASLVQKSGRILAIVLILATFAFLLYRFALILQK
jgi:hypothetical protein